MTAKQFRAREKEKKGTKDKDEEVQSRWHDNLTDGARRSIGTVISLLFALFFVLASAGKAGVVGETTHRFFSFLLGGAFFLLPLTFFFVAAAFLFSVRKKILTNTLVGGALFFFSALGLAELLFHDRAGGLIGFYVSSPLLRFFDTWVTFLLLLAFFLIGIIVMSDISLHSPVVLFRRLIKGRGEWGKGEASGEADILVTEPEFLENEEEPESVEGGEEPEMAEKTFPEKILSEKEKKQEGIPHFAVHKRSVSGTFQPPPLNLLETDSGKPSSGDVKANANIIKRTLQNFGIDVEMGEVNVGPSVTQYTLKPAEGIKISRISALQNDLALALAAHPLRLEAPIPGRSLVGIEIPNRAVARVGLRELLGHEEFIQSAKPLLFSLGRDVTGKAVFANLAAMPHLLIAGSTGSGKSINIHTILISLLYRNVPERMRILIVDPKRVELSLYKTIPHLLAPVVTDAKKAIIALRWIVKEMERRYEVLSKENVRDIHSYHALLQKRDSADVTEEEAMPYIIIVIDELADIMSVYPRELEASIVRLAQMSRAVGIHLIVSTQRPSVEVITGLIKANITNRIAFQVASQIDSRTVLDRAGAERLLGNGDMLFVAGNSGKPRRIQGAFVSEQEIGRVVQYVTSEYEQPFFDVNIEVAQGQKELRLGDSEEDDDDNLYEEARGIVVEAGKASASYLQRRLRIGYARAARLLDLLEERGVVGPGDGAKPREVLMRSEAKEFGTEANSAQDDREHEFSGE
ncbi:MAG: DNA translocase FtsK [Parcubacteria group bacterium]|nr:DNA translocase FtsK [Parcubacteria group bacterium]